MPAYFQAPLWADPLWACGCREILPKDDERLIYRCDHFDRFARFLQPAGWDDDGLQWCEFHTPLIHPDDDRQPVEVSPLRWPSLRARRRWSRPPTPAPEPHSARRWNVSDLATLRAAIEARYRRSEVAGHIEVWTPEEWELNVLGEYEMPQIVII